MKISHRWNLANVSSTLPIFLQVMFFVFYQWPLSAQWPAQWKAEQINYKITDIYITGIDKLSEKHIHRYLQENGIRLNALRTKKQLEKAARILFNFADSEPTLLSLELIYDYFENEKEHEVYVEVLVSEMSISFIPGGGNAYAKFGWANRIARKGLPSLVWLAMGYNRQDIILDLPYLAYSIFGFTIQAGHQIQDQWDFHENSRIRSNIFLRPELYIQPLSWLQLGLGLDAGLLYFFKGQKINNLKIASHMGKRLGLGPELNNKNLSGQLQGRLAIFTNLSFDQNYLANKGLGYHVKFQSQHELVGLFAENHFVHLALGLVTEPVKWLRPSLSLYGDWRSKGMLPMKSQVFSSRYEGYIRSAAEFRLLFTPIFIKDPIRIDMGWNIGSIVGFANTTVNFHDIDLGRDLEMSLFTGPELYFGMPVNVRGQFDFGIIFHEQFQKIDFAFHIRVL